MNQPTDILVFKRPLFLSLWAIVVALFFSACKIHDLDTPGLVLPKTVDQNPNLPQANITVAGKARKIHIRTFGNPDKPVLLFLHGSLGDHRVWLPFQALEDSFFVVMWDQRGNGLSERITADEISSELLLDEITAVADRYAPNRKVTLIGHSFGAMYSAYYLAKNSSRVKNIILIEPGGLNTETMEAAMKTSFKLDLWSGDFAARLLAVQNIGLKDHEEMDIAALQMLYTNEMQYYCDLNNKPKLPLWRPGGYLDLVRNKKMMPSLGKMDFDFASGLKNYPDSVLIIASTCSGIGTSFQRQHIVPLFNKAEVWQVDNTGHRLIVEEPTRIINMIRKWLSR